MRVFSPVGLKAGCYHLLDKARLPDRARPAAELADRQHIEIDSRGGQVTNLGNRALRFGTGKIDQNKISELIRANFQLTPRGIIESLDLRRPIYTKTASYGHFGRNEPEFSWEKTDKADTLKKQAGI